MNDKPVAAGKSSFDLIDVEKAFTIMNHKPDSVVLDLACGIGKYSIEIAKYIGEKGTVYAVDLWEEGIEALNQEISMSGIKNVKTITADIRNKLPFEDYSIDSCLMATILHDLSINEQQKALEEVARVLKDGGILNIIEFKKIDNGPGPPLHIRMDDSQVHEVVTPYGFLRVARSYIGEFNYIHKYKKSA
jgi:ubiquinone/menaquinone biosynthesis C-methylase UbiE